MDLLKKLKRRQDPKLIKQKHTGKNIWQERSITMRTFEDALNKRLDEPGFRAEYEALEPEFAIIQAMIDARKNSGLTQKQLA